MYVCAINQLLQRLIRKYFIHGKISVLLLALLTLAVSGCTETDYLTCEDTARLYEHADFPIGVAINTNEFYNNPVYKAIADKQFNSFTAENIFKPSFLHPHEGIFHWADADALMDFCKANGKHIHGHTLIWHEQLPPWILNFSGNSEAWNALFKNHIMTIVTHFKGKIRGWDVVNEAFNEDGTLRNSIWRQKIGNDYIERAFKYAREADPGVSLFYNDYNLESNNVKRNSVIDYFNHLRNRGVKIDGIGLQMHVGISFPDASHIAEAFEEVSRNNYKIHVSELDISVNLQGRGIEPGHSLFEEQADYLAKIVLHYMQVPSKYRYGITFWGVSDRDSWIPSYFGREDYPLLYDNNYLPKPAYCKLLKTL